MRYFIFCLFITTFIIGETSASDINAIKTAVKKKNYTIPTSTYTGQSLVNWYKLKQSDNILFRQATQFIATHKDWPDLKSIQKKAEENISNANTSNEIISFFRKNTPITATGMSHYLSALIAKRQTATAMQTLKNWWTKAVIAPNDQKMIIQKFGQYLGSQDHERRLRHIIHDKHYTASRSLAKKLGNGYPQLVEAKIALIENKKNVNQLVANVPASLRNNEALLLARIQWRRKNNNDTGAIDLLNKAPTYNRMSNPKAWWKERHIMARRLMEQNKWASAYKLTSNHRQKDGFPMAQAEFVAGWTALRKIGKPWEAFQHFERLFNSVESPISRARGAYWAGLASDTLGHPEIAMQWYRVAAKYQTTYYGQMAADRINLPLALLSKTPIHVTPQAQSIFNNNQLIKAAILLKRSGQIKDSKSFLLAYRNTAKNGLDFTLGANLSKSLGYDDTALHFAKSAERKGYIMPADLFPVIKESKGKGFAIHPAFSHAIMRQESAFNQHAQSHAGALGLMQLMPATAKETAQKAGMRYSKSRLTNDPIYNMTLGSLYIKQMLDRFDGNRTLAIAAYNAGPGRVSRWVKEFGDPRSPEINEVDWIEGIPVYETRNYVQRVTEALNVYARTIQ